MAAPIDFKTQKAIISTVRVEQDVRMINSYQVYYLKALACY